MKKTSDLSGIKNIALAFLYMPIEETDVSPLVVQHPVFESGFACCEQSGKVDVVNILESQENADEARKFVKLQIESAEDIWSVYRVIRKSYRMTFLKHIESMLSMRDFGEMLSDAWVTSENPNQDVNVSLALATKWFRKADKASLMTPEDYKVYLELPEEFVVYRGVANGRNPEGMSWTRSRSKANWFAHRFDHGDAEGYTQSATVRKENVLAYFNIRNEEELVVNAKDIIGLKII